MKRRSLPALALWFSQAAASVAFAQPAAESPLVARARELIDTYYGDRAILVEAVGLLQRAFRENPRDANIFVQSARATVMNGQAGGEGLERSVYESYADLLDRAIELDPKNAKAHVLKAEVYHLQGDYPMQLDELQHAETLDPNDPWLKIGFATYYTNVRLTLKAFEQYRDLVRRGAGTTWSEKKAFVRALHGMSSLIVATPEALRGIRDMAEQARAARHPKDAWTPQRFAELFIDHRQFEDAVRYAREALKTAEFPRTVELTYVAALYARAAQLKMSGVNDGEVSTLITDAMARKLPKSLILHHLLERRGTSGNLKYLQPTLVSIIP